MAFLPHTFGTPVCGAVCRAVSWGLMAWFGCTVAATSVVNAAQPSRTERIAIRRLERIEVLERRAEAAAEMPPRPADVRRMLRRGMPLSEILPPTGRGGPAAAAASRNAIAAKTAADAKNATAARPGAPAARGAASTPPAAAASAAQAQPASPPRPFTPAPATTVAEPPLRFPEQPATAIDDGTRSVLVREEPTPAAPVELLPTPQAKD